MDIHAKEVLTGNSFVKNQICLSGEPLAGERLIQPRNHQLLGSVWNTKRRERIRNFLPFRERITIGRDVSITMAGMTIRHGRKNKEYRSEVTPSQNACSNTQRYCNYTEDTFTTERDVVTDKLGKPVKKSSHLFQ